MANNNNYIDNKKMFLALIEYKSKLRDAELSLEQTKKPPVPEYIGQCILLIAQNLSNKHIFTNYTFKDDMISDGVYNCLQYIDNFDPEKSENPFAYFTQIIYYAFLRKIQGEKKHLYLKYKIQDNTTSEHNNTSGDSSQVIFKNDAMDGEKMNDFIVNYEIYLNRRKKVKLTTSDLIIDIDVIDNDTED